jgi:hypothetical protein
MSKVFWIVIIFLVIGGYMIKVAYDVDFGKTAEQKGFVVQFGSWLGQLGHNIVGLVGLATDQEWLPIINATNKAKG